MKEELIRVLKNKLSDINSDINSLVEINGKINAENESLSYVSKILDLFKDNDDNNVLNFSKITKEDFDKILDIVGAKAKDLFSTDSCNYDGLVYLINGINNGISLELNDEQKNGINYLIDELNKKVDEYSSAIDGYELVKTRYEISDVSELENKRNNYNNTIDNIEKDSYVTDTDLLMEALHYCDMSEEKVIDMLGYILEYNSNVYKERGPVGVKEQLHEDTEEKTAIIEQEPPKEDNSEVTEEKVISDYEEPVEQEEEIKEDNEEATVEVNGDSFDNNMFTLEENENHLESPTENGAPADEIFHFNNIPDLSVQEFNPVTFDTPKPSEEENINVDVNEEVEDNNQFNPITFEENVEDLPDNEEKADEEVSEINPEKNIVDSDFENSFDENVDYDETLSTRDLQKIFDKYNIKIDNMYLNELVVGDTNKYQDILETLNKKNLIDRIGNGLLVDILLNSNSDDIIKVLDIIEEDLSVDKDDYDITLKIALDTIPSIFVVDGGNFHNFIENTRLFKDLGLNLINLFDFSKEIFVANNDRIVKNLEIVKQYGYDINYKNAKYMLLLPNIGDRIDYYIESVYEDKLKNETFDGAEYIKDYAAKLNVVTDETIKRIRYSSENGRKLFGSKPKSLTGEITNLKVNALDISSDYLNKFFNNEFSDLTGEEVREYVKLIHDSSNVGNYSDELEILNPYQNGLRYVIEGINISSNKVVRNYNILRSYGMDMKKALEFAVCYNLVITKEEYDRLNSKLNEIGGNL